MVPVRSLSLASEGSWIRENGCSRILSEKILPSQLESHYSSRPSGVWSQKGADAGQRWLKKFQRRPQCELCFGFDKVTWRHRPDLHFSLTHNHRLTYQAACTELSLPAWWHDTCIALQRLRQNPDFFRPLDLGPRWWRVSD